MSQNEWWRGAAIYHVYLPSFSDSNGDGIGDLRGLLGRLDYIAALGVDAIWISPFYISPMADWGYDVADYCAVDPQFGSLADFDAIVTAAHGHGLRIVIDLVWSHTSIAHPWFQLSESSRNNPKHDWYVWADASGDGTAPNNWLSVFGGSAWRWSPRRRQYYLHHFLTSQPKLNLRNEAVLTELLGVADFWLKRGVDGFRFDAVDFMLHDESLRSNPSHAVSAMPWNPFRLQRHVHDMCNPGVGKLLQRVREFMDRYPGVATIGEISSEVGALARIATLTGGAKLHMAYTLGAMKAVFSAATLREQLLEANALNRTGWLCWAFSNHDVARVASRWNPSGSEAAAFARLELGLLLTLPGSVSIFQGEELGLPEADLPFAALRDPFGRRFFPAYAGRDGARTPMPWVGAAPHAGFSTAEETWLPIDPRHVGMAADRQAADPQSTLSAWRRMLAWRKKHASFLRGDVELVELPDPLLAFQRHREGETAAALFNLSDQPVEIELRHVPSFEPAAEFSFLARPEGGIWRLPPYGFSFGFVRA